MMTGGTMYDQRDVVLLPFPYTDLTASKLRPALIISNSTVNNSSDRICLLITSNPEASGLDIPVKLPYKSKVKPQRLFLADTKIIRKKIASVSPAFHKKVISAVIDHIR